MGTRKENRLAGFVWAFVCALAFGLVACGDDSSSSPDEQSLESSSSEWNGDVSGLNDLSSSSHVFWGLSSSSVIGTQPGDSLKSVDSLKSGDTLVPQDSLSHDTYFPD